MAEVTEILIVFEKELNSAKNLDKLETLRVKYLGRNGQINNLLKKIKEISSEDKKEYGEKINKIKLAIEEALKSKELQLVKERDVKEKVDITRPGAKYPRGSLHLVTYAVGQISRIFEKIGFIRLSYPEIEWEYFSFESLNMPEGHPARDDFETFFVDTPPHPKYGRMLLTPHTSSGQIREMMRVKTPPIRMINISKTYRPNWDVSHTPMFHQFEGLCIDEGINITNLKGTIEYFAKEFFGEKREIRLRPFHFQFTEPSFEVDITCDICAGTGIIGKEKCKLCKSGWLELGGAGMVHPNVIREGNIDPEKYSGWAFGFGIERTFMMKEGLKIDDIRALYSGDIRFLEQF